MSLEALPAEPIGRILALLDTKSIKRLRLVSHEICSPANSSLLSKISLGYSTNAIDTANAITAHGHIASCGRSLAFNVAIFPRYRAFDEWNPDWEQHNAPSLEGFNLYKMLGGNQRRMLTGAGVADARHDEQPFSAVRIARRGEPSPLAVFLSVAIELHNRSTEYNLFALSDRVAVDSAAWFREWANPRINVSYPSARGANKILAILTVDAIKNLRLANKAICYLANPFLLSEVSLRYTTRALHIAKAVAAHPQIARFVRRLVLNVALFKGNGDLTAWARELADREACMIWNETKDLTKLRPESIPLQKVLDRFRECKKAAGQRGEGGNTCPRATITAERRLREVVQNIPEFWKAYQGACMDQDRILHNWKGSRMRTCLETVLEACPSIHEVVIKHAHDLILKPAVWKSSTPPEIRLFSRHCRDLKEYRPFSQASRMRTGVTKNRQWQDVTWQIVESWDEDQHRVREYHPGRNDDWGHDGDGSYVLQVIALAPRLHRLHLGMTQYNRNLQLHFPPITWSHLNSVRIDNFETSADTFTPFLLRHASTLESLPLSRARLADDQWMNDCFSTIAGNPPALTTVRLTGKFYDEENHKFCNFDRRRGKIVASQLSKYIMSGEMHSEVRNLIRSPKCHPLSLHGIPTTVPTDESKERDMVNAIYTVIKQLHPDEHMGTTISNTSSGDSHGTDSIKPSDSNDKLFPKPNDFIPLLDDSFIGKPAIMKDVQPKPASDDKELSNGAPNQFLRLN
ncbi:uncharacterized protein MYCGRDRAFT_90149 [Zymoseptoria tritici IPO323]|uniref:F-box domain-containing protein n=3 Tax=Zymoseptoria tritici TaxID=1047171 RepID=F9X0Q2_ZYMTI|nr:uncharacterized protein MYCGRDRAFT_90149 [Zymoseptoria tritici IPO323]EGP91719.1 hypothetical protein MYCGRDRAFT_90149 [Zymoseptoria tritici IPO323]